MSKTLTRNTSTKANRNYWEKAEETLQKVNSWPKWKRDVQIGSGNNTVESEKA